MNYILTWEDREREREGIDCRALQVGLNNETQRWMSTCLAECEMAVDRSAGNITSNNWQCTVLYITFSDWTFDRTRNRNNNSHRHFSAFISNDLISQDFPLEGIYRNKSHFKRRFSHVSLSSLSCLLLRPFHCMKYTGVRWPDINQQWTVFITT